VSSAAITLCVVTKRVFVLYFVIDSVRKLLDIPSYVPWRAGYTRTDQNQVFSLNTKTQYQRNKCLHHLRGPFAKFVDSPYYSELEFSGGVTKVPFMKYLP
jgi:hypothetical protein